MSFPAEWYTQQNPDRFLFYIGEQVVSVNHTARTVTTDKHRTIDYDICVLATGSTAGLPTFISPQRAQQTQGIFVYRNIADLDAIMAYAEREGVKGGKAAIVGGGLLGLEAAKAVYDLYVDVVLNPCPDPTDPYHSLD
jgi:nitrite reductase (NAD(P)H)